MTTCLALEAALASHRARFDQVFTALFLAVTSGLQWGIIWWYRRQPVVWVPAGWMPAYAESLLNIGGAPKGMPEETSFVREPHSRLVLFRRDRRRVCHDLVDRLQKGNRPA